MSPILRTGRACPAPAGEARPWRQWPRYARRGRASPARTNAESPRLLLPPHVEHEERLVGGGLPLQLAPRGVDRVGLVEADAGHVLAQDLEGAMVLAHALGLVERGARRVDRGVELRVRVLRPDAAGVEQRVDHAVGVLAGAGPGADRQ